MIFRSAAVRIYWKSVFGLFALFTLMRAIFFMVFRSDSLEFSWSEVIYAFYVGGKFDLRVAVLFSLLLLIVASIRETWVTHRPWLWRTVYFTLWFLAGVVYGFDFGYFAYLENRLNITALGLLKNFDIAMGMVWQTYNIPLIVLGFCLLGIPVFLILRRFVFPYIEASDLPKKYRVLSLVGSWVISVVLLHGSLSQYPLRWSDAFFSSNNFLSHLALNPIHYFIDTASATNTAFDKERTKQFYASVAKRLGVSDLDAETLQLKRPLAITNTFPRSTNVVYIVMESFAAYKTKTFGNPLEASPHFDQLAAKGLLFTNFFTPTEGTARSMFCALTGIPDINADSTSSRNPQVINQHTLLNYMINHQKLYFIGGSASWGNIRGVYKNNVAGLQMFEDKDFERSGTDVWGLSDLDLFKEAARILKEKAKLKKPFFALIQSASFHRPYTIPVEKDDFELLNPSPSELKNAGFRSAEELNSFRFSDYSLGRFFELIRDEPFFKNTLFVIHGDHGLPHNDAEHLSTGYKHFGLNRFHVPLLFYAPNLLESGARNEVSFEPDVMATIVGSTGHSGVNTTLGRNLFAQSPTENPYIFSYVYYANPLELFLLDEKHILAASPERVKGLYDYQSADYMQDIRDQYPEKFQEMSELVHGFFEASRFLLHHNPKLTTVD